MHKGKVRDTCGDIGDVEACKHGVEHCNCRRKRSRTSESVSSDHDTAHRKPQNVVPAGSSFMAKSNPQSGHSKYSGQVHPNRSGNTQINTLELKEKDLTDRKSFNKGARGNWREKAVEKGKTKYLWTDEVKNMPSEGKKGEPTLVGPVSSNPKYGPSKDSEKSHPPRSGNTQNTSVQEAKDIDATLSPAIDLTSTKVIKRTDGHLQRTISKKPCADCHSPMSVEEFFIEAAAEEPLPTDPAPDASWMGSFILKDEKISISFQAHPTSKGLLKVKEFSKQMPQVLEFELCLYEDFLRTFFKGCDPGDKDIGLYFFPNRIRLHEYISQLEKLSGNIFLRSCINGIELLVFTSKVLHKDYHKRNKCDFLWGMYRRRPEKSRGAAEETDRDSFEDSHAEVVKEGKEIVGTVDAVVTEQSIEGDIEVPPGFSPSMRGHWIMEVDKAGEEIVGTVDAVVTEQSIDRDIDVPPGFSPSMRGRRI